MIKILLVEDDKKIRRYLEIELSRLNYVLDMAEDGEIAIEKIKNNCYDLILLDLMLPKISGEEVCTTIRKFSTTPIIIISSIDKVLTKISVLDLGADDYITKPFIIEELLARIRVSLRRQPSDSKNILLYKDFKIDRDQTQIKFQDKILILTRTEYKLLEYFILNREIILNREQIISNVWGYDYLGDDKIVDAYIKILRKKINTDYIKTIRGFGYQFIKGIDYEEK